MAKKRASMKGMGADAFFETPVSQDTSKPANQYGSIQVEQQEKIPASQQTSMAASQHTGKADEELIKATFYLTQEHIMKLEHIRLGRKEKGIKVDKSSLIREAINRLKE